MPRRTRRWSFVLGALLAVAGLALLAQPLVAGAATPSAVPLSASPASHPTTDAASDAACCRTSRRGVDFDPAPALGMLGLGGVLMLAAAVAAGTPSARRLA
jgi:hypothetical protein